MTSIVPQPAPYFTAESTLVYDTPHGRTYRDEGVIVTFGGSELQLTTDEARDLADQLLIAADATDNGVEGYHLQADSDSFRGQFG